MRASGRVGSKWYDERRRVCSTSSAIFPGAQRLEPLGAASGTPDGLTVPDAASGARRSPSRRRPLDDADGDRVGRPVAEREAEDERHEDREGEDPEERLGLADELEDARPRQRGERVLALTHRAAPGRSAR